MPESNSQFAFYFDASACSGCKACQVACKDKHQLPVGMLWRRVYEVTGGEWKKQGNAWYSDVFAYNISISCNHCARPICVEVCPACAITKRADGIVLIAADRCLGCQYCSWACPYDALQYDERCGRMTKCTLCVDNLERGLAPACVAACPMRVLDFGMLSELRTLPNGFDSIPPLASPRLTEPALVIKRHPAAARPNLASACIANGEEVSAKRKNTERPLVFFTLLAQLAVGVFVFSTLARWSQLSVALSFVTPALMALAMLVSFLHLGSPLKSWRAFFNLRSSWLSREIFLAAWFFAASTGLALWQLFRLTDAETQNIAALATLASGLGLVFVMAQVYRLRTVPKWNSIVTPISFFITAFLLGALLVAGFVPACRLALTGLGVALVVLQNFFAQRRDDEMRKTGALGKMVAVSAASHATIRRWRWGLAYAGIAIALVSALMTNQMGMFLAFAIVLASEVLGRFLFYENYAREEVPGMSEFSTPR